MKNPISILVSQVKGIYQEGIVTSGFPFFIHDEDKILHAASSTKLLLECYLPSRIQLAQDESNDRLAKSFKASVALAITIGVPLLIFYAPLIALAALGLVKLGAGGALLTFLTSSSPVVIFLRISCVLLFKCLMPYLNMFLAALIILPFNMVYQIAKTLYGVIKAVFTGELDSIGGILTDFAKNQVNALALVPLRAINLVLFLGMPLAVVLQLSYAACAKVGAGVSNLCRVGLFSFCRGGYALAATSVPPLLLTS